MPIIAPSLLAANFLNLQVDIEMLNKSQADWLHLDIMDGVFVPNISFGLPILKHVKKITKKPLDVHLMIVHPEQYIKVFKDAGANIITVHYEACIHLHRTIRYIKQLGIKAGVSLNPHTPVDVLTDIITDIDLVLIMSVNPGFGSQLFITNTFAKLQKMKELAQLKNSGLIIEVDGGVRLENAARIVASGANALVSGSCIFDDSNPEKVIASLKSL